MKCLCNHCSTPLEFDDERKGETIECPACKLETQLYDKPSNKHPDQVLAEQREASLLAQIEHQKEIRESGQMLCRNCETQAKPRHAGMSCGGSLAMVILWLWCFGTLFVDVAFFIFALLITIAVSAVVNRRSSQKVCPACRSMRLVPLTSPAAKRILGAE